jgi:hypothetical protein
MDNVQEFNYFTSVSLSRTFRSYSDIVVEKLDTHIQYCPSVITSGLEIIK